MATNDSTDPLGDVDADEIDPAVAEALKRSKPRRRQGYGQMVVDQVELR
jgi:hypothetical protein